MKESLSKFIPDLGLNLAKFSGSELLEKVGEEVIREVVTSILCGGNVRSLTEGLTQRRISLSNAALLVAYLKASKEIKNLPDRLPAIVSHELQNSRLSTEERIYLQWFIGLTGKSIQNVLRSDKTQLESYLEELEQGIINAVKESKKEFGDLHATVTLSNVTHTLNWQSILQIFAGVGAQTLAIRGSEKSMYGKFFEKLILGSLLTLLGVELIDPENTTKSKNVFWLSQRESKRESDATILYKPGTGVRFDIGFIGPGNTEISLDKVSRFEKEMVFGKKNHFMSTIIIVDRIGDGSRITELAKNIDGNIVQMSMNYWVKEVATILHEKIGFSYKLVQATNAESIAYIEKKMKVIELGQFIAKK